MKQRYAVAVAFTIMGWLPASALAASGFRPAPDGFGEIAFEASGDELRAAFPAVKKLGAPAGTVGGDPASELVEAYQLADFPIEELGTCSVTFHLYMDRLGKIDFFCRDRDKVGEFLEEQYGPHTSLLGTAKVWQGAFRIVYTPHLGTFSFSSEKMQAELQTKLIEAYREQAAGVSASQAPR